MLFRLFTVASIYSIQNRRKNSRKLENKLARSCQKTQGLKERENEVKRSKKKEKKRVQKKKLIEATREISIKTDFMSYKKEIYILLVDDEAVIYHESQQTVEQLRLFNK